MTRLAPLLGLLLPALALAQPTTIHGLGDLPGYDFNSEAHDVSADGHVVVGQSLTLGDDGIGTWRAFRWTEAGGMVDLGDLPGGADLSHAFGVSYDGSVVVGYSGSAIPFSLEAFRWTEVKGMQGLGSLPGSPPHSLGYGVSGDGSVVVGQSDAGFSTEAFRWENGTMAGLGFLPGGAGYSIAHGVSADGDVVVGYSHDGNRVAFRWEGGVMTSLGDLPGGGVDSWANAATPDGSVVVGIGTTEFGYEPFRWTAAGGMEVLRGPKGEVVGGEAFDVSADGSVVVGGTGGPHALVWTEAGGLRRLRDVLTEDYGLDLTGWSLDIARGVSDDGRVIVGTGFAPTTGGPQAWRVVLGKTVAAEAPAPAEQFALGAPHPNPFQEQTTLVLDVPEAQHVEVEAFDVLGRRVAVLHDGPLAAGTHRLAFEAKGLPAGTYLVRAVGDGVRASQRVTRLP